MSKAYRLTERAEADVEAIADYIASDNIDAAVKVVLALEDAFIMFLGGQLRTGNLWTGQNRQFL